MADQTSPLSWCNNTNTITQADPQGTQHNIAYIDADWGMQIGPDDPRFTLLMNTPLNFFRPHIVSDFNEVTLDPKWTTTATNGASYSISDGCLILKTGTTLGGSIEATMPNTPMPLVAGTQIRFYLTTLPNGNLDLEFGMKVNSTNVIRFRRTEGDAACPYHAQCMAGNVQTDCNTGQAGDSVRRFFCISITSSGVDFYIGNDGGQLTILSHITTNIPSGTAHPYIKLTNSYAADREVYLDVVYAMPIR